MKQLVSKIGVVGILVMFTLVSFSFSAQAGEKKKTKSGTNKSKVTICHKTGSTSNPYQKITVSSNAVDAHQKHGDIIPAPQHGCPTKL